MAKEISEPNPHEELSAVIKERDGLRKELEHLKIMMNEMEQTNNNLISATWRERDLKKQLKDAMAEVVEAKEIIEIQSKRISESINYAKRIQKAIIPTKTDLLKKINNIALVYKPKDVVSGDFPWTHSRDNYTYIGVVDCTGHGVPGAMMSLIGILLLNDIVNNEPAPTPAQILNELHVALVATLKQNQPGSNSNDGMDIALCRIDHNTNELIFAGAHRPLYLFRQNLLSEIKGDKFPIGGIQYERKRVPFNDNKITLDSDDSFFMFSDGLPDQVGGEHGRKFLISRVQEIIRKHTNKGMESVELGLVEEINSWMQNYKQVDDILFIGSLIRSEG